MSIEVNPSDIAASHEPLAVTDRVAVLDCGGQYIDLVQKACIRLGFPADVLSHDVAASELSPYKAVIVSGSPGNSQEDTSPLPDPGLWESDMPILGICFGMQAMAQAQGGAVERGVLRQDGRVTTHVQTSHPLFQNTKSDQSALFTHGNFVTELPEGFTAIGEHTLPNGQTTYSAIARGNQVAVQFHPEVFDDTPEGYQIFKNFLQDIAGLEADPSLVAAETEQLIAKLRSEIRTRVGDKHVIAFVSGGVDSSVATTLAATEIEPEKLHAYYIDNGFMRDEDEAVVELLQHLGAPVTKVDATEYFLVASLDNGESAGQPLVDITDPQAKRQIIGKAFIEVQNRLITELGLDEAILLQGTNAADRIESGHSKGGAQTALIKTHHNQVQEVQDLKARGLLLEPLDELFKDEVRTVGRFLGLPDVVVDRHPFPGPGLAIRILCATGKEFTDQSAKTEQNIQSFIDQKPQLDGTPTKAKLLPVRNVGVGGDERSHIEVVALESSAPWEALSQLSSELTGTFRNDINRVIVALQGQPLDELFITPTKLDQAARTQLRHADRIVFEEMRSSGALEKIKQCPVVLLPLSFGTSGNRSIVLRPVVTSTFMTVQAMLPERDLPADFVEVTARRIISEVPGVSNVFLDLTPKPPGTTEWE